jgi:CheY-like chemotaxis protein
VPLRRRNPDFSRSSLPDIKTLFISGYTADILHKKGIMESHLNFVSKPVFPDDLARKVRSVLDS